MLLLLLFEIVMEMLSRMMSSTVDRGLLSGFPFGSKNNEELLVFRLLFVDTLISCDTNYEQF